MTTKEDDRIIDEMFGIRPPAPAEATPGSRLARLDAKYRAPAILKELSPRHRLMQQYMVHGTDSPVIARQLNVEVGEPMSFYSAADGARVRRREARRLMNDPLFRRALAGELRAFRESKAPRALQIIEHVMEAPGEDKAADRKVRLQAAQSILGEEHGGSSVSVNVGVAGGGSQPLRAGVVIRLKHQTAPVAPIELQAITDEQAESAEPPQLPLRTKL